MERLLNHLWIPILTVLLCSQGALAGTSFWDQMFKKLSKSKTLELKAGLEQQPVYKLTPKLISFRGVVEIPSEIKLVSGSGKIHPMSGQLIFDGQIVCNYSPKQNGRSVSSNFVLTNCSDGSRAREDVRVDNKVELKLNMASSDKASLVAKLNIISKEDSDFGLLLPYLEAEEGQVLTYNGEAWVAAYPETQSGGAGAMGPQGPQGVQGEQGPVGAQGPKGDNGDAGVAGAAGAIGPMGPQGLKGEKGDAGIAGAAGAMGAQGPMGPQGLKGNDGSDGAPGAAGAMGPQGPMGPQGLKGNDGSAGVAGAQGPKGDMGQMGVMGPQGSKGDKGDIGLQGPQGLQGLQGEKGDVGSQGLKGDKGDRGLSEIAYLRDERTSGMHGGDCTSGLWNTRQLNVLGGDTGFISLAGNRFVLQPGKYFVEATAPGFTVNSHQAKLKVIETNADVLIGSSAVSIASAPSVSHSIIAGEIVVASASTFEVQHRCQTTKATNGLGQGANFGTPEVYTQIKIIKKQ